MFEGDEGFDKSQLVSGNSHDIKIKVRIILCHDKDDDQIDKSKTELEVFLLIVKLVAQRYLLWEQVENDSIYIDFEPEE